jgi:hypothetical protein
MANGFQHFAFKFNLRRYTVAAAQSQKSMLTAKQGDVIKVGTCNLMPVFKSHGFSSFESKIL